MSQIQIRDKNHQIRRIIEYIKKHEDDKTTTGTIINALIYRTEYIKKYITKPSEKRKVKEIINNLQLDQTRREFTTHARNGYDLPNCKKRLFDQLLQDVPDNKINKSIKYGQKIGRNPIHKEDKEEWEVYNSIKKEDIPKLKMNIMFRLKEFGYEKKKLKHMTLQQLQDTNKTLDTVEVIIRENNLLKKMEEKKESRKRAKDKKMIT